MCARPDLDPTIIVVFGTTGDLMAKKIVPSLYHLRGKGLLPERLCIVGFGRRDWEDEQLREHVRAILAERAPHAEPDDVERFLGLFVYQRGQFDEPESYSNTAEHVARIQSEWGVCANKLFYLAVPPEFYERIFRNLADSGMTRSCSELEGWTRVLVEKPFGDDQVSARGLDTLLGSLFREEQVYRIDHYLAKEMLQGIMNFRFANNLFEAEWGREAIEAIDITLNEEIGVERRGAFYDAVGALRDVGQNHLLQMLALVTMDQPASASPADIREARADLIESLVPMSPGEVARQTYRAQHEGYRAITGVAEDSQTETYFRLRSTMGGRRWSGVRFSMESGKRLGPACKRIVVRLRHPHPCMCEAGEHHSNKIVFTLEPSDRIEIVFYAKAPGFSADVEERRFSFFLYERAEKAQYVEEYARLLYDAIRGDQTLFVSTREVDAGWRFIDPIVEAWQAGSVPLETYVPDTADVAERARETLEATRTRGEAGVVGLGKMGAGLARNLMDHGWRVVGFNRTHAVAEAMAAEGLVATSSLADLVSELAPPRTVLVSVPAGAPVDEMLFGTAEHPGLADLLAPGDVVLDTGNSYFGDALPRAQRLGLMGIGYLDCGTSGGPDGARYGACLMVGGDRGSFDRIEPLLADIAAPGAYRHVGTTGAGHYVKMVHNGIEYGMMQAIAEGFAVLHEGPFDLDLEAVADLYQHRSVIESRLVGWARDAFADLGDDLEGVSAVVGHSGEAEWTVMAAEEADVDVPIIAGSLAYRKASGDAPSFTGRVLTALRDAFGGHGLGPGGGPRR